MKNNLSLALFLMLLFITIGCKNQGKSLEDSDIESEEIPFKSDNSVEPKSIEATIKNMGKVSVESVAGMKIEAEAIIAHRYKETGRKPWIILDKDLWEYEFIFSGKEMTKPGELEGHWIDFNEDQTYTYGYFEDQNGSGKYTFDLGSGLLLLIDNSDKIKPQEVEAKLFDRTLIMDGNEIYQDNNFNSKLKRITSRPKKVG